MLRGLLYLALSGTVTVFLHQVVPCKCLDDPCTDYELIDMYDGRREKTYESQATDVLICDDNIDSDKWMRFMREGASYQLSNDQCIDIDHCGAQGPMWMSSTWAHPTAVGEEVEANACVNYGLSTRCSCSSFSKLTVRLCENNFGERYYVYRLPQPPDCYTAYCVNPEAAPCPPKKVRDRAGVCVDAYPAQTSPSLSGPVINGNSIEFYCEVFYAGSDAMKDDARFDVKTLFWGMAYDDVPIITVKAGEKALLAEEHIKGHMGTEISCSSTPYWDFGPGTDRREGKEMKSTHGYYMGVLPDIARLAVNEADTAPKEVHLRATLPVVCKRPDKPCRVCTRVVTADMAVTGQECEVCFEPADWKPAEKRAYDLNSPLRVSAVKNVRLDAPTVYAIDFEPFAYKYDTPDGNVYDSTWEGYTMNDIGVTFTDTNHGICSSTGDPHLRSFDGKYFHVYDIGEFELFTSSAPRVFQVQARYSLCKGTKYKVSCGCAVAVREGNAVLGIDICGSPVTNAIRPKIKQYSQGALPLGAQVTTDRVNSYFITMPSGAYVKVDISYWGLNIYVHALAEDKTKSSGLCGNFDGDKSNDLTIKGTANLDVANNDAQPIIPRGFSESYRIEESKSFFDFFVPEALDPPDSDVTKCRCDDGKIDCSPRADVDGGGVIPDNGIDPLGPTGRGPSGGDRRRKRDVDLRSDLVDDEVQQPFNYGPDSGPDTVFTWPTQSGITETVSRQICEDSLDALPYKDDCVSLTGIDVEDTVTQCIEDIKIMDNTSWAQASLGYFQTSCQFLALQDRDLYTPGPDGKLLPPMQILGKMCPSQCSGHGTCVGGICECDRDFIGPDCGLEKGTAPILHYIPGPGHCDLTLRLCRQFRLVVSNFIKTDQLTCRVAELRSKAVAGKTPVVNDRTLQSTSQGTATFQTSAEISCNVPEITSQDSAYYELRFDFSYDGLIYSNQLDLTVFDGKCISCENDCDNRENWIMLPDTCIIDGRCVAAGVAHTAQDCQFVCDPNQSTGSWTPVTGSGCPTSTSTTLSTSSESTSTTPSTPSESSPTTRVATSLTASLKTTTAITSSTTTGSTLTEQKDDGPPIPLIAGVCAAGIVILIICIAVAVVLIKRRNSSVNNANQYEAPERPIVPPGLDPPYQAMQRGAHGQPPQAIYGNADRFGRADGPYDDIPADHVPVTDAPYLDVIG